VLQPNVPAARRGQVTLAPRFWIVLLLTGVAAGLIGGALTLLLHLVQEVAFAYAAAPFLQGVEHAPWWRRLLVPALAGLVAGLGWWALRGPLGRRLGDAPGVSASVWSPTARPALVRTALDGLLQTVVVAMGASLGREGAPREVAAALGSRLSELVRLDGEQRRLVVACGAGAGLAAVYDVPLGGALFTLEVLLGSLALPLVVPAGVASVLGAVTAWLLLGDQPVYPLPVPAPDARVIVFAVAAAPLAALAAVGFVRLVGWSRRRRPTSWRLPLATVAVFTALGALAVPLPELLGNGKGPVQLVLDGAAPLGLLAVLAVLKPLLTAASLRSGANGGLFTPILATGALLGAVLGGAWSELWPGGPAGGYALVGGAAFLAAAWQAPLSAIVLVLELTRDGPGLLVPVALAALLGTLVARLVEPRSTQTVALGAAAQGPPDPLGSASGRAPGDRRIS
jgi:chloride channel protein, CIC family